MATARISRFLRTITLLITIFSLSFPAFAKYNGGTGEPNDPYQIATAEDHHVIPQGLFKIPGYVNTVIEMNALGSWQRDMHAGI